MGIFKGIRTKNGAFVTYDDVPLELRLDLREHSPMGFEWGYNGSGPRQLALAILTKFTSDDLALEYYEEFCEVFIEPILDKEWEINDSLVREWLNTDYSILPQLTSRFEIIKVSDYDFLMKLDNNQLGIDFGIKDSNTCFNKNGLLTLCNFSEISYLRINELPESIIFSFTHGANDTEADITDYFTLKELIRIDEKIVVSFYFAIEIINYIESNKPLFTKDNLLSHLNDLEDIKIDKEFLEETYHWIYISVECRNVNETLATIVGQKVDEMLTIYEKLQTSNENTFKAVFNFPQEYKGVLKPYLQYFEEFLNDLCINADVDISTNELDTILSVKPQNKDEALEKIADALKAYLCAPVIANGVSMEESLQMQTVVTKLYAQCKNLESQMMYKELSLREQGQQIEIKDNIINESKRVLVEAGVDTNIITQNNTMLLESLKSIKMDNKETEKKVFFSSGKATFNVFEYISGSLEFKRKKV